MSESRITSKGQVTLPKAVREVLGVEKGDRVAFRIGEDGVVTVEAKTGDLLDLEGILKPRRKGVTLEDMDRAIRDGAAGRP